MRAPSLETIGMTKIFGSLVALEDVSIKVEPGTVHALLGENGAGKSTLVKCIMGFYSADKGQVLLDGKEVPIRNPRDARALGIGMVYQHFTLVPSLTGAENLVISRADAPAVIDWKKEMAALEAFLDRMPFRVPLDVPVSAMAAGEKQKLEILKLLYLDQRLLILDEPTSVLTPDEADEMLGLLRGMTHRKEITVIMITHKFREVLSFCDSVTVLRRGRKVGGGEVKDLTTEAMARMMIGDTQIRDRAVRNAKPPGDTMLELAALYADDDEGLRALDQVNLKVHSGEIVGIAGVSGNGQSELVEVLAGQRPLTDGRIIIKQHPFEPNRDSFYRLKIFGLPEEPLKNATVPRMTVAENMAFRTFDRPPAAKLGWWLSPGPMREKARELIARYRVKTPSPETAIADLSGGNIQRAVLARELSGDVDVLIVANPCFGLDFASVAEIRSQIMEQRNHGAAVLAGLRRPRRDSGARRPGRGDVRRHDQLSGAGRRDRPLHHRQAHGRALIASRRVAMSAFAPIIFDYDGTLFDTRPAIVHCIQRDLRAMPAGRCRPSTAILRTVESRHPLQDTFLIALDAALARRSHQRCDELRQKPIGQSIRDEGTPLLKPFPGVAEALRELHAGGTKCVVVSNKGIAAIRRSLDESRSQRLSSIWCWATNRACRKKPDPALDHGSHPAALFAQLTERPDT